MIFETFHITPYMLDTEAKKLFCYVFEDFDNDGFEIFEKDNNGKKIMKAVTYADDVEKKLIESFEKPQWLDIVLKDGKIIKAY